MNDIWDTGLIDIVLAVCFLIAHLVVPFKCRPRSERVK